MMQESVRETALQAGWSGPARFARRFIRLLAAATAVTTTLTAAAVGGVFIWLHSSTPSREESQFIPLLAANARIGWDRHGIPRIFAHTLRDAYVLLGWCHARDRMWQMEMQRRRGQGRLAEILGPAHLDDDVQMRVLDLRRRAAADYFALDAATRADLDAYAAGINSYLSNSRGALPIEFHLLRMEPETWHGADSLLVLRLLGWQLSGDARIEALRARLSATLSLEKYRAIFPAAPMTTTSTAATAAVDWAGVVHGIPKLGPSQASNEWVVGGALTSHGKPLLANDPHLALQIPVLWYLAGIATDEGGVTGATVPGLPFHLLGHNGHIAWGFTSWAVDVADLFVEVVNEADAGFYETPQGLARFTVREELVRGSNGEERRLVIRESRHGPIISDHDPYFVSPVPQRFAVSLAFVGWDRADPTLGALRALNHARDWSAFLEAAGRWRSPALNAMYADIRGNIGLVAMGKRPGRRKATDLPLMGNVEGDDWNFPTDHYEMPRVLNPPSHFIVNANNEVGDASEARELVSRGYVRAQRISELLTIGAPFDVQAFSRMQLDIKAGEAPKLLAILNSVPATDARSKQMLAALARWDGMMDADRPEPLIFSAWAYQLDRRLLIRNLGMQAALASRTLGTDAARTARLLEFESPADRTSLLQATLSAVGESLANAFGPDPLAWKWGDAHRVKLLHPLLAEAPIIGGMFGTELPVAGGTETVNRGATDSSDGVHFPSTHGPGFRAVYDLADLSNSRFILATGQSGDPLSSHFLDQSHLWSVGQSVTIATVGTQRDQEVIAVQRFSGRAVH